MNKIIRKVIFFGVFILICSTTLGLSFFSFDKKQNVENTTNAKIDDIEENYTFGKNASDKSGKTYTIYFFPSASYMYLYHDYITKATSDAPEEQFGYKEAYTKSDGTVAYKLSENTGTVSYTGHTSSSGTVTYDGAYRRFMGELFSCSNFEADGGSAYDSNSAYSQSQSYLSTNNLAMRTWGIPNDAFTIFDSDSNREENFNGRNQYSTDRFGCWGDCYYYGQTIKDSSDDQAPEGLIQGADTTKSSGMDDTNTGRYLPIKLTVTNELTSSIMESVVQSIFTSMGTKYNGSYYHNYTFTEWTYVTNPDNPSDSDYPYSYVKNTGEWQANKIGEAFQPKQRSTYFDMLSDLDKYADKNGVIRLYPLFSNGKKNGGYEDSVTESEKYTLGGGSTEKLTITSSSNVEYKYPFFNSDVYNDGEGNFTYVKDGKTLEESLLPSKYINLFSYNNIEITSNTSKLVFSANNIWNNACGWGKEENDSSKLYWQKEYTLNSNYIKQYLLDTYGSGLYTFYVVVANYSYQNGPSNTSTNSISTMKGTFDTFYNNIASQITDKFTSLNGKRLVQITSLDDEYDSYKCSPTVVFFEKIDEPSVYTSSSEISDVSSFITQNESSSRNFYRNVNPIYEGEYSDNIYNVKGENLQSSSPYTYIIKNVDLSSSKYFILSFNSSNSLRSLFNTSTTGDFKYLITNPSTKTNVAEENVYTYAFGSNGFITYKTITDSSGNEQIVFELLDDTYLDVYDLIIKYSTSKSKYEIYMRRHNKLFLYIFDKDLEGFTEDNFVDHKIVSNNQTANGETRIFDKEYAENNIVLSSDTSTSTNSGLTLDETIRNYVGNSTTYSDSLLLNYKLIDRVTGSIVGYYVKNEDSTYSLKLNLTMDKNHILYIKHEAN